MLLPSVKAGACVAPNYHYECYYGARLYCHYDCYGKLTCVNAGSC